MSLAEFDNTVKKERYSIIAGVDEAGRGPLAGPIVAAACIFPRGLVLDFVNDSKLLTSDEREEAYRYLISHDEIIYGIGFADAETIDKKNILQATFDAMLSAIENLGLIPDYLLIDGKYIPKTEIPSEGIIGGDRKSQSIAAASIIAKYTRDKIMDEYHKRWPEYGFDSHKGYGTDQHLSAIKKLGIIPTIHRKTYEPIKTMLKPDLFQEMLLVNDK